VVKDSDGARPDGAPAARPVLIAVAEIQLAFAADRLAQTLVDRIVL
jgi:hypothetical protein